MMKNIALFKTSSGENITTESLLKKLHTVGANIPGILFIHTEMSFGAPNLELGRQGLFDALYSVLEELGADTLCVPTFTFSFCNGQDFSVNDSKSKMGVFNEYFRKRPDSLRSTDPLMSVAAIGKDMDIIKSVGKNSVGKDSVFDLLHKKHNVKFLFLGTSPGACMTYTHYVEAVLGVPYRYYRKFTGSITDKDGKIYSDSYDLFVRYQDVIPATDNRLQQYLLNNGSLKSVPCGDSFIYCIDEKDAYGYTKEQIEQNIDYMLDRPYPRQNLDMSFVAQNMVAL